MSSSTGLIVALILVVAGILILAKLLRVQSSEPGVQKTLAVSSQRMAEPMPQPLNTTPNAMPGTAGRLITHGSQSNPPEPGGYIADSEITEITPPTAFRIWNSFEGMYPRSTFDSDSYGSFFYPTKTGHYVRSGFW